MIPKRLRARDNPGDTGFGLILQQQTQGGVLQRNLPFGIVIGARLTRSILPEHPRTRLARSPNPSPRKWKHHPATTRMAWRSRAMLPCEVQSMRIPERHA